MSSKLEKLEINLTEEDILNVVLSSSRNKTEHLEMISYSVEPVNEVTINGLSFDYFNLVCKTKTDDGDEESYKFLIKSLPLSFPADRNRTKTLKLHDRELEFYSKVIQDKKDNNNTDTIKWYSCLLLCKNDYFIIEDLSSFGYKKLKALDNDSAIKKCIRSLSQMHADCIAYQTRNGDFLANILPELETKYDPFFLTGISTLRSIALKDKRNQSKKRQNFIEDSFVSTLLKILNIFEFEAPNNFFKTICHCNLRPDNIYMKSNLDEKIVTEDNDQCIFFVNFENIRYAPPAIDLLIFLYYNLQDESVEEAINKFGEFYYENLTENCKKAKIDLHLTMDEFRITLDHYKILAMILRALDAPFLCNSRYAVDLRKTDPEQYIRCMAEDRMTMIELLCKSSTKYEKFITETTQAVIEYFDVE